MYKYTKAMAVKFDGIFVNKEQKPCKFCRKIPRRGFTCVACEGFYHPGCVKFVKYPVKYINIHTIKCCDKLFSSSLSETLKNVSTVFALYLL